MLSKEEAYMELAITRSRSSHAKRLKVGAILVKGDHIISDGYNGTPAGFNNECEDSKGKTKSFVLHAEANAIAKVARSNNSSEGSILYVTTSPCMECAKLIIQARIAKVYYLDEYRDLSGLNLLWRAKIPTEKILQKK